MFPPNGSRHFLHQSSYCDLFFLGLQECSVNQDFIGQGLKGIKS